jgi:hypothetical protein
LRPELVVKKLLPYLLVVLLSSCNTFLSLKEKVRAKLSHATSSKKNSTSLKKTKAIAKHLENKSTIAEITRRSHTDSLSATLIGSDSGDTTITNKPTQPTSTNSPSTTTDYPQEDTTLLGSTELVNTAASLVISDTIFTKTGGDTKVTRGDTTILSSEFDYTTKIRIITINKITKDTIIEWLTPEEASDVSRAMQYTIPKATAIAAPKIRVDENALFTNHMAVYFVHKEGERVYQLQGDTLFVQAPEKSLAELYQKISTAYNTITPAAAQPPPKKTKSEKTQRRETSPRKVKVDSLRELQRKFNDSMSIVNINLEKALRKRAIDSTLIIETANIPINDTLIGDPWLDNDPEASMLNDATLLKIMNGTISDTWHSLKVKVKVNYRGLKDEQNANVNIRMINDSCTWASVNVVLEAMRVLIEPDSTRLMNRLKDNYVVYNNSQLQDLMQLPIEAKDLQDLIVGSIPIRGLQQVRAKTNNTIIGIYAQAPQSGPKATLLYNADSTLRSVYLRGNNKQGYFTLRCLYSDYIATDMGKVSTRRDITSFINGVTTNVSMELSKIEFNTDCDLPFEIPTKFKRVENIKLKERK